jgi:hypothetical protein
LQSVLSLSISFFVAGVFCAFAEGLALYADSLCPEDRNRKVEIEPEKDGGSDPARRPRQ